MATHVVRFGMIADIQYCDTASAKSFSGRETRDYRGSLAQVQKAVIEWKGKNIDFIVNLGDTIDGKNSSMRTSQQALRMVFDSLKTLKVTLVHLIGNHELYNFTREQISSFFMRNNTFSTGSPNPYYSFRPSPSPDSKWVIIALDSYQEHSIDTQETGPEFEAGKLHLHSMRLFHQAHIIPPNGAYGTAQRTWLKQQLAQAQANGDKVLILAHVPVAPRSCIDECLAWDFDPVMQVLSEFSCVCAFVAGHDHEGGYVFSKGIHFLTMPSPLLEKNVSSAHAVVELHHDKITIESLGAVCRILEGVQIDLPLGQPKIPTSMNNPRPAKQKSEPPIVEGAPAPKPAKAPVPKLSLSESANLVEELKLLNRLQLFKLAKKQDVEDYRLCADEAALRDLIAKSICSA